MEFFTKHAHWAGVNSVCLALTSNGYVAWLAGGCVRDWLMQREPQDFDVATSATPDQVGELFANAIEVGKSFGVMIVPFGGYQVEIATFRADGPYHDGRRPEKIAFAEPKADAERRDFTCNALFFDPVKNELHDFVGGQADIQARLIRAVGDPVRRFTEDKLRMLRAVRFSAQLGFQIESKTWQAVLQMHDQIHAVSRERIRDELKKLLLSSRARQGLELLWQSRLGPEAFPELDQHLHGTPGWAWALETLDGAPGFDFLQGVFLLVWPWQAGAKPSLDSFLRALKLSASDSDLIKRWLAQVPPLLDFTQMREGELLRLLGEPNIARLLPLMPRLAQLAGRSDPSAELSQARARLPISGLPLPWLTGEDLKTLGVAPGPDMGRWLNEFYLRQLERRYASRDESLAALAAEVVASGGAGSAR